MTPPDKAYFAGTNKERSKIILSFGLFLAGLSILSPRAGALQYGSTPAKLAVEEIRNGGQNLGLDFDHNSDKLDSNGDTVGGATPDSASSAAVCNASPPDRGAAACDMERQAEGAPSSQTALPNRPGENSTIQPSEKKLQRSRRPDLNREIYYRNKLEFSLDGGWFPINVPFPFNVLEGDPYNLYPLRYTLVPMIASLRWHLDGVKGPVILRGNWDVTFSGSYTAIPRGAETRYFSYDMGIRRNFVPRNWRAAPYWDIRLGLGYIDAKGPLGVYYAQGQNFTFNMNMGSGVRYNFNSRYAFSAGLNWMHISNANLSSPYYSNYGINVYGPIFGIDVGLRQHSRHAE